MRHSAKLRQCQSYVDLNDDRTFKSSIAYATVKGLEMKYVGAETGFMIEIGDTYFYVAVPVFKEYHRALLEIERLQGVETDEETAGNGGLRKAIVIGRVNSVRPR